VYIQAIPGHNQRAINVPEELAKKIHEALSVDVSVRLKAKVQTDRLPLFPTQGSER
jgi:hypothetical protein